MQRACRRRASRPTFHMFPHSASGGLFHRGARILTVVTMLSPGSADGVAPWEQQLQWHRHKSNELRAPLIFSRALLLLYFYPSLPSSASSFRAHTSGSAFGERGEFCTFDYSCPIGRRSRSSIRDFFPLSLSLSPLSLSLLLRFRVYDIGAREAAAQ